MSDFQKGDTVRAIDDFTLAEEEIDDLITIPAGTQVEVEIFLPNRGTNLENGQKSDYFLTHFAGRELLLPANAFSKLSS
jgi:hypothetical protein